MLHLHRKGECLNRFQFGVCKKDGKMIFLLPLLAPWGRSSQRAVWDAARSPPFFRRYLDQLPTRLRLRPFLFFLPHPPLPSPPFLLIVDLPRRWGLAAGDELGAQFDKIDVTPSGNPRFHR